MPTRSAWRPWIAGWLPYRKHMQRKAFLAPSKAAWFGPSAVGLSARMGMPRNGLPHFPCQTWPKSWNWLARV